MLDFLDDLPDVLDPPDLDDGLRAPFPYFGGKSRAAELVWDRLGDVTNYVEPFFGSGAVLLARPAAHRARVETVNDLDALVLNFWRATAADPANVARLVDWPVFEVDLHARHRWLIARRASLAAELEADPRAYDLESAAWWAWGASCWIGAGWCANVAGPSTQIPDLTAHSGRGVHGGSQRAPSRRLPDVSAGRHWDGETAQPRGGKGVHGEAMRGAARGLPSLGASGADGRSTGGRGVNAPSMREPSRKIPNLIGGNEGSTPQPGHGVHAGPMREPSRQLPDLGGTGTIGGNGVHRLEHREPSRQLPSVGGPCDGNPAKGTGVHSSLVRTRLYETFERLAARLRYVRFACGDWSRVCTKAVTWAHGLTGVFLDPPYSVEERLAGIYACDSATVAAEVRAWCAVHGMRSDMRIALCGYGDEHAELERLGWTVVAWKARGGYGNQGQGRGRENAKKERIWFSPACDIDGPLFGGAT